MFIVLNEPIFTNDVDHDEGRSRMIALVPSRIVCMTESQRTGAHTLITYNKGTRDQLDRYYVRETIPEIVQAMAFAVWAMVQS